MRRVVLCETHAWLCVCRKSKLGFLFTLIQYNIYIYLSLSLSLFTLLWMPFAHHIYLLLLQLFFRFPCFYFLFYSILFFLHFLLNQLKTNAFFASHTFVIFFYVVQNLKVSTHTCQKANYGRSSIN